MQVPDWSARFAKHFVAERHAWLFATVSLLAPLSSWGQSETFTSDLTNGTPPYFRINGIAGFNQISDSALRSASGTVQAEFNLIDVGSDNKRFVNAQGRNGLVQLEVAYNFNAEVASFNTDSVRLSDLLFYQRSRNAYEMRAKTDVMRWFSTDQVQDKMHYRTGDTSTGTYYRVCPFVSYSYARWNFDENILAAEPGEPAPLADGDRIQAIQWATGLELWHVIKGKENSLGIMFGASFHQRSITEGTLLVYEELLNDAANTAAGYTIPRVIDYYSIESSLQVNKTRITFSYSDVTGSAQDAIIDQRVTGGVFLIRVSTSASFLSL